MRTRPMAEVRVRIISMPDSTKVGKSTPRWERLFDNVTVFQAVLGRQIGTTDPRLSVHLYHRLKSGATRNPFEIGVNMILMQNKPQIGCALSHIELWKEVVAVDRPTLVVEEDVVLGDDVKLSEIEKHCTADFVSLMHNSKRHLRSRTLKNNLKHFWGAQAYYVRPAAARILLANAFPLDMHIDRYIPLIAAREDQDWLVVSPQIQFTSIGKSSLDHVTYGQALFLGGIVTGVVLFLTLLVTVICLLTRMLRRCTVAREHARRHQES